MKRFLGTAVVDRLSGRGVSMPRAGCVSVVAGIAAAAAAYRALRSGR